MKAIYFLIIQVQILFHGLYLRLSSVPFMQGSNLEDPLASISRLTNPDMISKYFFITLQMHKLFAGNDAVKFALSQKIVSDIAYFHAKKVPLTNESFFKGEVGSAYTNLQQFISPENETRLITSIRYFESNGAGAVNTLAWTAGIAVASLQNGVFTINQNNNVKVKDYPLVESISSAEQFGSGIIMLDKPVPWVAQQPFDIQLDWEVAPTANSAIWTEVRGLGLI